MRQVHLDLKSPVQGLSLGRPSSGLGAWESGCSLYSSSWTTRGAQGPLCCCPSPNASRLVPSVRTMLRSPCSKSPLSPRPFLSSFPQSRQELGWSPTCVRHSLQHNLLHPGRKRSKCPSTQTRPLGASPVSQALLVTEGARWAMQPPHLDSALTSNLYLLPFRSIAQ